MKNLLVVLMALSFFVGESAQSLEKNVQPSPAKILKILLIPTGYGLTKLMKNDYYLASLLIDKDALFQDSEGLIFIDATKRMEFKFVTDRRISGRTFGRQIAAAIKINNSEAEVKESKTQIKRFIRLFKRNIKKGDVIRFDYHDKFGTRIYHNNRRLGEIPYSNVFYRVLLRMWLGDRPPSTQFKKGIMGLNGNEYAISMQQRYQSI